MVVISFLDVGEPQHCFRGTDKGEVGTRGLSHCGGLNMGENGSRAKNKSWTGTLTPQTQNNCAC